MAYVSRVEGATEVIRALMREQGVSSSELARRLKVSRAAVSQTLSGKYAMSTSNVNRYAAALGFSASLSFEPKSSTGGGRLVPKEE